MPYKAGELESDRYGIVGYCCKEPEYFFTVYFLPLIAQIYFTENTGWPIVAAKKWKRNLGIALNPFGNRVEVKSMTER
ncbi:MAG TPA: hypothetical protein VHD35_10210 [Chitinophagaceae bacterium]|nr:hypothetical protein [Chitinophagaceae bacterium]